MATTFPSQRDQGWLAIVRLFAVLAIGLVVTLESQSRLVAQGEAAESEQAVESPRTFSGITSGIGNTVRGIFGGRESSNDVGSKATKPAIGRRDTGLLKPGAFRAGFAKQIRATTDPDAVSDISVEESPTKNAATPSEPSSNLGRVASKPYQEPFTKAAVTNSSPKPTTLEAQGASLDPPSLVGTGFRKAQDASQSSTANGTNRINRFNPSSNQSTSGPKSPGLGTPNDGTLATRPLPEVVTPQQMLKPNSSSGASAIATEKVSVERKQVAKAKNQSNETLNERVDNPNATTRKATRTADEDPRELVSGTQDPTHKVDRQAPTQIAQSSDLSLRSTPEEVLQPVSKKAVPVSSRQTPTTSIGTGAHHTAGKNTGYDSPSSGYPLTSKQITTPESSSFEPNIGGAYPAARTNSQSRLQSNSDPRALTQGSGITSTATNSDMASTTQGNSSRIDMSIPKVRLYVAGPTAMQVAKSVPYEVVVKNEGTDLLSGVIVSMSVPVGVSASSFVSTGGEFETEKDEQGTETVLWHVSELGPSQSRIFRLNLEASKPEHFSMDVEWTVLPQSGQVQIAVEQPQLTLAIEGPSEALWGKPELYRLKIRNPGNAIVKNVQVKLVAETFGSNESTIGDIPPGGEKVVEVELTFQQLGKIAITGQAASKSQSLEAKSNIDVAVNQIKLESQWNAPDQQYLGSVEDYRLTIHNRSSLAADSVTCAVTLPDGLSIVHKPEGAIIAGKEIRWNIASIKALESLDFDFTFQANESVEVKLRFNANCSGNGSTMSEAITSIDPIVDLKLTVVDPVAPAPVGQDVQYDLVILNRGTRPARNVKVVAQFSNGIEPIRAEGVIGKLVPGQVLFDAIDTIGPGQQITLRIVAQASEAGVHRFRAELQCEDGETQLIEEESTRYLATSRSDLSKPTVRR